MEREPHAGAFYKLKERPENFPRTEKNLVFVVRGLSLNQILWIRCHSLILPSRLLSSLHASVLFVV